MVDYEHGISRLIERVRGMAVAFDVTTLHSEIMHFSERLKGLASDLDELGSAQFNIECEHDKEPTPDIGLDGYPMPSPDWGCTYKATLMHMGSLADSAKRAADSLPKPRQRLALRFAAMGVLHLRYRNDFPNPRLSDNSPDVQELKRVCEAAGIFKSIETLRNALSTEMKSFDRHYFPPGIWEVIDGG